MENTIELNEMWIFVLIENDDVQDIVSAATLNILIY